MSEDLCFLSLADAARRVKAREISPVDLVDAVLERIERHDDKLHAFVLPCAERAREQARDAEVEIAAGRWKGPLHGIPVAVKDIVDTAGVRTTGNSALFKTRVPTKDAVAWERLSAAGAILIGKTTTWEFALGGTVHDLPWPPARNPWDPSRDTGGSSSGSAVALAAGFAFGAIGTDTSGSIRIPAAWCGVAGLKPTYGLVSRTGIMPLSSSCDHAGPICRTSEDCALMLQVMAGFDPQDPGSATGLPVDYAGSIAEGIAGLRVGVLKDYYSEYPVDAGVRDGIDEALSALAAAGADISEVSLAPLGLYDDTCNLISRAESYAFHRHYLQESPELYGKQARARLLAGGLVAAGDYIDAQRQRRELIADMARAFTEVDIMVSPVIPDPAPPHGGATTYTAYFTRPFSITGNPAHSVCTGFGENGLPLAIQIVARPFEDHLALRVGHIVERALQRRERPEMTATA